MIETFNNLDNSLEKNGDLREITQETNNLKKEIEGGKTRHKRGKVSGGGGKEVKDKKSDVDSLKNENPKKGVLGATEEDLKKENEKKSQEILSKEKTYRNPRSGLTFCLYDQNDPRRGKNIKPNDRKTMSQTGCLLTSAAVVHSMLDPSITPEYYRKHYTGKHPYDSVPEASNHKIKSEKLTVNKKTINDTIREMIDHLNKGYPVNFMVHGPKNGHHGKNPYVPGQHYMTAVDVRGEKGKEEVFVANTHNGKGGGWYPANKMFISLREASLYTPTQA